ncbi:MAG: radical SAM protein [Nanoarchaeota archaeon]
MVCIEKIYSVSALVGNGNCNANCNFCAGKYLRPQAKENPLYYRNLEAAIKLSARYGGWSLSLTSSGEPTQDPVSLTKALEVYDKCAKQGAFFPNVNLFTNGINFGDSSFCNYYLPIWRELGLTNIALSIHSVDEEGQAKAYNLEKYPRLETIVKNIEENGVGVRGTLLLRKGELMILKNMKVQFMLLLKKGLIISPHGQ